MRQFGRALRMLGMTAGAVATLGLAAGAGCSKEYPSPPPASRADAKANLPPKPELVESSSVRAHADGAWTVEGLMREKSRQLGEDVTVRGVVTRLVSCPEPPPPPAPDVIAGEEDVVAPPPPRRPRTCNPPPHAFIHDKGATNARRELLVYGSMWSPLADLTEGAEVTLTGRFTQATDDGVFLRQAGIVELPDTVELPPEPVDGDATP